MPSDLTPVSSHQHGTSVQLHDLIRLRHQVTALQPGARKKVDSLLSGHEQSLFKGRGIDFEEVRRYQAGDDIRHMDWRVTARSGSPHIKLFREERQRQVFLIVDFSSSMFFGTRVAFKSVIAAQAASLLAWASNKHGDRIGGMVFADTSHREVKPQSGTAGVLRVLHALVQVHAKAIPSNTMYTTHPMSHTLARVARTVRPGSVIFLLSDFHHLDHAIDSALTHLSRRHNLVAVSVTDPLEQDPPPAGRYHVSDGTHVLEWDTTQPSLRDIYTARLQRRHHDYEALCRRLGIGMIRLFTHANVPETLRRGLQTLSRTTHQHRWRHTGGG